MPTNRKRKNRSYKGQGLTADQREFLLTGRNLLTTDFPFRNEKHRRQLWLEHRAELLVETGPDRRPHAWWCFSAPEKRRRIIGGNPDRAIWKSGESFGKCRLYDIDSWDDPRRPIFLIATSISSTAQILYRLVSF